MGNEDGTIVVWPRAGAADVVNWTSVGEAMAHANELGARYGRPILTGLGVAEDDTSWFIRVDLHSMEDGDSFMIVRNPMDQRMVATEVQRIADLNKARAIADMQRMNDAYAAQLAAEVEAQTAEANKKRKREQHRAAALAGWRKRRGETA